MKACMLCSNNKLSLLYSQKKAQIHECKNCNLGITKKTTATTKALYKSTKFYNLKAYKRDLDKHVAKFERVIEKIRIFLDKGKILDIGSGYGLFPQLLGQNNFNVVALEPHLENAFIKNQKEVAIVKKDFMKLKIRKNTYDGISFLDSVEHFKNPVEVLTKAHKALRINGFVFLLLPNYKSLMRAVSPQWAWWMPEDHHFHFSRKSVKKILNKTGFKVVYMNTFENMHDFWANMQGNLTKVPSGWSRLISKACILAPLFVLYLIVRPVVWYLGKGGLLLVVGRKK